MAYQGRIEALSDGADDDPILIIDFVRFSGDRTLGDVVAEIAPRRKVLRIDAVADLVEYPRFVSVGELADGYQKALAPFGSPTILGYCSAAALTLELAARGCAARTLLVAPMWPTRTDLDDALDEIRAGLGYPCG